MTKKGSWDCSPNPKIFRTYLNYFEKKAQTYGNDCIFSRFVTHTYVLNNFEHFRNRSARAWVPSSPEREQGVSQELLYRAEGRLSCELLWKISERS